MDDIYDIMGEKEETMIAAANNASDPIEIQCQQCGRIFTILTNRDDVLSWLSGSGYIQDLMPYLSAAEREMLISGTCDDCWKLMFGEDEK